MADYDLATITASLAQNFRPAVVRTFNAQSRLLRLLRVEKGEGKNVAWDVEGTGAVGENFSDGADVSAYGSDVPQPATLSWGLYRSNFKVTNLARSTASSSRSPEGLVKLMGRSLVNSTRKLASSLNVVGYTGAGTGTTIAGLDLALDDANTYAGILRSTGSNSGFRAKKTDPGTLTDPTLSQIRKDLYDIRDICGEMPDIALCCSAVFLKIAALFDDSRVRNQDVTVNLSRGQTVLDASVGAIVFEGCVFLADKDATTNKIYYLNSNYVYWQYLPAADADEFPEDVMLGALDDGFGGPMPLGLNVYPLARTGAARKVTCETQLQLVVEKPNACGVRLNVTPAS